MPSPCRKANVLCLGIPCVCVCVINPTENLPNDQQSPPPTPSLLQLQSKGKPMAILRRPPALSPACAVVSFPCRPSSQVLPRPPSRSTLICLAATPKVPLPIASPASLGDDPSKWDPAECNALLRGGEQVASVLQEMLTLVGSCFVFVRLSIRSYR